MAVSGGIRFLPIYGQSGSGKTSAAQELSTHLPECEVFTLTREAIESQESLNAAVHAQWKRRLPPKLLIAVVDQYEENVARRTDVPTRFVEALSLLDRGELRTNPTLFLWLTTSKEFQGDLAEPLHGMNESWSREVLRLQGQYRPPGHRSSRKPSNSIITARCSPTLTSSVMI